MSSSQVCELSEQEILQLILQGKIKSRPTNLSRRKTLRLYPHSAILPNSKYTNLTLALPPSWTRSIKPLLDLDASAALVTAKDLLIAVRSMEIWGYDIPETVQQLCVATSVKLLRTTSTSTLLWLEWCPNFLLKAIGVELTSTGQANLSLLGEVSTARLLDLMDVVSSGRENRPLAATLKPFHALVGREDLILTEERAIRYIDFVLFVASKVNERIQRIPASLRSSDDQFVIARPLLQTLIKFVSVHDEATIFLEGELLRELSPQNEANCDYLEILSSCFRQEDQSQYFIPADKASSFLTLEKSLIDIFNPSAAIPAAENDSDLVLGSRPVYGFGSPILPKVINALGERPVFLRRLTDTFIHAATSNPFAAAQTMIKRPECTLALAFRALLEILKLKSMHTRDREFFLSAEDFSVFPPMSVEAVQKLYQLLSALLAGLVLARIREQGLKAQINEGATLELELARVLHMLWRRLQRRVGSTGVQPAYHISLAGGVDMVWNSVALELNASG